MGNNNSSYNNGHVSSKSRHLHPDFHHRKYGASSSDLGESSGNRMKRGYLPTRGYHGHHAKLPSPHKVLPTVTPAVLLKPTSNGAILHQGGTISGRKLLSELDMRKRSTASCPGNGDMMGPASGRSTPNLSVLDYNNGIMERNGPRRASSKGGNSSRDYDSEPDLRDMDDSPHHHHHDQRHHRRDDSSPQRSISPVPNSFTLIQESPAKKQIRTKKKGKAPPPPISPGEQLQRIGNGGGGSNGNGNMPCCSPNSPQLFSPCGESKKASSRLFKTKAESRLANSGPRSPEICSDLESSRGNVVRASMNANRFSRGDRDRSSVHSLVEAGLCTSKSSPMDDHHLSNRKHSANSSSRNNPEVTKVNALARDRASASSSSANIGRTSSGGGGGAVEGNRSTTTRTSANNATGASSSAGSSNIISLINQSGIAKDEQVPKKSVHGQSSATSSARNASPVNQKVSTSNNQTPKGFVSSGNSNCANSTSNVHNGRRKSTAAPAVPITTTATTVTENSKNNNSKNHSSNNNHNDKGNKSMFYFGMQQSDKPSPTTTTTNVGSNNHSKSNNIKQSHRQGPASAAAQIHHQLQHQPSDSDNNNNDCRSRIMATVLNDKINDRLPPTTNGNHNHHYYQEKISSSTSSELLQIKQDSGSFDTSERLKDELPNNSNRRDSSSELSSSDLDIPLQIRPTLPLKKLGLPRFSPSQAWRALDTASGLSPEMSFSGRSYSGSEDNYGHDRIQPPRMRQLPPSRGNLHERSAGDSGISAGDGGSPANNHDLLAEPCLTPSTSHPLPPPPVIMGNGGAPGGRGYKLRERAVASGKQHHQLRHSSSDENKCWTPEQDLDESSESSEFEDQPISPPHHPPPPSHARHHGSNVATRVLPAGLRGRNAGLGIVSDSEPYHLDRPGNLYVRSRKTMNGGVGGAGQKTHEDMKKSNNSNQAWRQDNHLRHADSSNGNWFLSRSLNSLNLIGNGEYDNIEQQELRLVLAEQDDDNVEPNDNEDEMLHLPPDSGVSKKMTMVMNMHGKPDVFNNDYDEVGGGVSSRLESEIGYGPSSMNFSSPLPSPSAVKINRNKMNHRRSSGAAVGESKKQVIASTHLLPEEFERDPLPHHDQDSANVKYGNGNSGGGGVGGRRPFSHIMYLPAYDSRRTSSSGTRRTKSVDNLNFSEMSFQQRKVNQYNSPVSPNVNHVTNGNRQRQRSRSPFEYSSSSNNNRIRNRMIKRTEDPEEPFERSQSVPPFTAEEEEERRRRLQIEQKAANIQRRQQLMQDQQQLSDRDQNADAAAAAAAERERAEKKRKFKFQSTLRVLERKKIEEQLSREAEEKERRRLEEKEQMRKVEEEFQRKRVREKVLEIEAANKANLVKNMGHHVDNNRYDVNFEPRHNNNNVPSVERNHLQRGGRNSGRSSNISYSTTTTGNHNHLFQRQEPEGAPASATNGPGGDLRKELISASRTRSGFPGQKHPSELTQELSEFCTPTGQRQYFDYRRAHEGDGINHRSGPTTRYYNSSSSSDIFPVTSRRDRKRGGGSSVISSSKSSVGYLRPTVHPQVVCDIPVKRLPYVVNFSRLSSSNMDLLTDQDRPRSGLGGNASVLSDNYRKDWAHHNRGNGPARASSVISLNSAPPLSNLENFRHSSVDLTLHTPPQSPRQSKYSTSPSASPVSHSRPLSSPEERFQPVGEHPPSRLRTSSLAQEMWNGDCVTGNKTVVMLNTPTSSSVLRSSSPLPYQAAPAPFNRKKSFRPVDFNPNSSPSGLSPAHAFHHASAKLTAPTPVN